MFLTLFKLRFLKAVRSVTLGRRLIGGFLLALIGVVLLSNILFLGLWLQEIMASTLGSQRVIEVINTNLIFYFFLKLLYRYFLQKVSAIELQQYLPGRAFEHHPFYTDQLFYIGFNDCSAAVIWTLCLE